MKLLFAWSVCNSLHLSAIYHDVFSIGLQFLEPISTACDVMMYKKFERKKLKQLYVLVSRPKPASVENLKIKLTDFSKRLRACQTLCTRHFGCFSTIYIIFCHHHCHSWKSAEGAGAPVCLRNLVLTIEARADIRIRSQKTRIWERHESAQMIPGSPVPSSLSQIQGQMKTSFYPVWSRSRARGDREVFSQMLASVCWVGGQMGGSGQDTPTSPYCQTHVSHMLLNMWQSWRTTHDLLQSPTVWPDALAPVGEIVALPIVEHCPVLCCLVMRPLCTHVLLDMWQS